MSYTPENNDLNSNSPLGFVATLGPPASDMIALAMGLPVEISVTVPDREAGLLGVGVFVGVGGIRVLVGVGVKVGVGVSGCANRNSETSLATTIPSASLTIISIQIVCPAFVGGVHWKDPDGVADKMLGIWLVKGLSPVRLYRNEIVPPGGGDSISHEI